MENIRNVRNDDFSELAKIYTLAYNSVNIGENWDDSSALKLLKHLYSEQPDLFFVAEENGKVVGGITAPIKPWWDGNHLTDGELFVHPNNQKHGLGKLLIKKLFTEAKKKYDAVSWDTFTHRVHEHPLKWYKSLGFKEIEKWVMIEGNVDLVLENLKEN